MNPNDCDHPDLTAHVLGELDTEHAEAMAKWMESNPEVCVEAAQISDLAQMLAETAPISFHRLTADQRTAVLSGPQRVRQMVAAVQQPNRQVVRSLPMVSGMIRMAAAASIAIAGYLAGAHFSSRSTVVVATGPAAPAVESIPAPRTPPFRAQEVPQQVVAYVPSAESPVPVAESPAKPTEPKMETVIAAIPPSLLPSSPSPAKPVIAAQASNVIYGQPFVNTSKSAQAQVSLRPSATRPPVASAVSTDGPVLGAPMSGSKKDAAPAVTRAAKQPDLLIHSWKAEVVSCPWDESHRLVRLVVQIPGEQPAAAVPSSNYALQMNFSPNAVRSFRQLGERTIPAAQADSPAFHISWFEVVPNGQLTEGGTRTLGDIILPNARFTTQAMAPFDSSKLHVLDRGISWQNAREDFLFESAVIGFNLLLKGEKEIGSLDHAMVLDLAQRAKPANDEYAKFIKVVKDAGRVAGLK